MVSIGESPSRGPQQWLTTTATWEEWTHPSRCLRPTQSTAKPGGGTSNSCIIHKEMCAKQQQKQQSRQEFQENLCAHLFGVYLINQVPTKRHPFPAFTSLLTGTGIQGHQSKAEVRSVQKEHSMCSVMWVSVSKWSGIASLSTTLAQKCLVLCKRCRRLYRCHGAHWQ